jgi:hypothetical protein
MAHILGGIGHGKTVEEEIAQRMPRPAGTTTQTLAEGIEGTPIIVNGQIIGWNIGGEFFTQEEVDALIATGKFPEEPTTGTGRAAPSFASTQAAQTQDEAFRREQAQRDAAIAAQAATLLSQRQAEQDKLDREFREEAALKRGRLSTLTDLIQSFVASQSQARDTLANLQPDPFRFAAVAGGIAPFGTTPQQGFTEQLQQFAGAPVPTADPNASLPSIESAIQGLTGANVPLSPQVFGAAGGATIPAPPPGQSVNVKVGERGEEILRITAQGVEVIPIMAAAQEGGFFPFEPIPFDESTLFPALATSGIFEGFSNLPRGTFGSLGRFNLPSGTPTDDGFLSRQGVLSRLGIAPSFISPTGSDRVFFVDPSGVRRNVSREAIRKIDPNLIVNVGNVENFGPPGGTIGGPGLRAMQAQVTDPSPFTKFSAPIIEPTTGTLLPAPFMVASQMNRLRLTNPTAFNLLLSAYEAAGVPATAVLSGVQAALPFGQARTNIGLN